MFSLLGGGLMVGLMIGFSSELYWWGLVWGSGLLSVFSVLFWYSSLANVNYCGDIWVIDGFSGPLISLTIWVCCFSMLGSLGNVLKISNFSKEFVSSLCSLMLVLVMAFGAGSLFGFYVFFEASLIPTLLVILGWGYQPERLQAGKYMMLYTVGASLPLLALLFFIWNESGSVFCGLKSGGWWSESWIVGLCLGLAFWVKLPIYGVHLWLPKAHVEAPVAGSMVLAGVLLKLGGYGLIRVFSVIEPCTGWLNTSIVCLGLYGGVMASLICCSQVDMKALIAYSSVGHMSLVLGGVYSDTVWGWNGALLLMLAHGLCSAGLFFLANESYKVFSSRSLFLVKGGLVGLPGVALCWFVFSVVNMAAPPSMNLWSEIMLGISVLSYSIWFLILTGALTFVSAVYSLYVYSATQHGQRPRWAWSQVCNEEYLVYIISWGLLVPVNAFSLYMIPLSGASI
uniref:NADH-ubiquinone oxidoreductase chain 4 n=1 Tax=Neotrigonia margaritacea TaxID=47539 RepID=A0A1X9JP66_9BIVA|nr:NADH dehydrogenase subunit 4 [Neotrigonia margaritacea]AQT38494.1 NADH dehydrogenase subunit 4 [Neotrigonia margaritacea]